MLQQQLSDAQYAHARARHDVGEALRDWNVERIRHDDAKERWRAALARGARESREHG
ncbi:hypothetical protein [Paraburkholderia fungorum]|nr:hypothetical protein [Paraburkholderia fungorum]